MAYRGNYKLGVDVVRCEGDLNASEMVRFKERLSRLMSKNHKRVVLDLSSARRVDVVGVGILVDRLMKVRALRGDIKLCNMSSEVAAMFSRVGVSGLMQSFQSEEEALQSFATA